MRACMQQQCSRCCGGAASLHSAAQQLPAAYARHHQRLPTAQPHASTRPACRCLGPELITSSNLDSPQHCSLCHQHTAGKRRIRPTCVRAWRRACSCDRLLWLLQDAGGCCFLTRRMLQAAAVATAARCRPALAGKRCGPAGSEGRGCPQCSSFADLVSLQTACCWGQVRVHFKKFIPRWMEQQRCRTAPVPAPIGCTARA